MKLTYETRDRVRFQGKVSRVFDVHSDGLTLIQGESGFESWFYQVNPDDCAPYTTKSLNEMKAEVVEFEKSKGWVPNDNRFLESLALLHSEISEALEAYRDKDWDSVGPDGKREGVTSELADVFIRTLSTWAQFLDPLGHDLEEQYELKMAYNRNRPWRHGGRTI